jgi:hypothetical protein
VGDFNVHHSAWFSTLSCTRVNDLVEVIEDSSFCILNCDTPTLLPNRGNLNSLNFSLISVHLAPSAVWTTHIGLNSDHLPITIDLGDNNSPAVRHTRLYTNFRFADWVKFVRETEVSFRSVPDLTSCATGEKVFRRIVFSASGHSIPSGFNRKYTPGLPREAVPLTSCRDELRRLDPLDPEIPALNEEITAKVCELSRKAWMDKIESCSRNANPTKFWSLICNLSGKRSIQPPNQPIMFSNKKTYSKPLPMANKFNKQFMSVGPHKQNPVTRRVIRLIKSKHVLNAEFSPFTDPLTADAIKLSSNSSATGPDGLTSLHLKHLGLKGISYLTKLYNLPIIWKKAHIIPIPKPEKPLNLSSSYCPISLLSPAVKICECLPLPFINPPSLPLSSSQHGFRPFRLTTTAVLSIITAVANGFNQEKLPTQMGMVSLDISKAFNSVNHTILLKQLSDSTLHSNMVRWLATYLRGHSASCLFRSSKSKSMIIHSGVPQGFVLSPSLWNFFTSDFSQVASLNPAFADDFYVLDSAPDLQTLTSALNEAMKHIEAWANSKGLVISPEKSSVTLFTPDPAQHKHHLQVYYKGSLLPQNINPRALGFNLDPKVMMNSNTSVHAAQGSQRNQILKAVSGNSWGQSKETLLAT